MRLGDDRFLREIAQGNARFWNRRQCPHVARLRTLPIGGAGAKWANGSSLGRGESQPTG